MKVPSFQISILIVTIKLSVFVDHRACEPSEPILFIAIAKDTQLYQKVRPANNIL